jgi:hypothetical protein
MATTTKGTEITAMPSATLSTTKRVIVRARPYPNAVAVAGAAGAVVVVIVMVDEAVAVCGTGGKAPHNFIPLGDQVFQHIQRHRGRPLPAATVSTCASAWRPRIRRKPAHEPGPHGPRLRPACASSSTSCGAGCNGPAGARRRILRHYRLTRLEELPALTATRILERLIRLDHDARQVRRREGGEAGAR